MRRRHGQSPHLICHVHLSENLRRTQSYEKRNGMTVQKKALWVLAVVAVFALVSCATMGKDFDRTHVTDIKTGVQDKNQIRDWFGEPNQKQSITDSTKGCVERWNYIYGHSHATFGGFKTKGATLVVDFDQSGKVCDHGYSYSEL
jgi:outer membrane protein assembly factor BamE (lipoprotein component of BamABCDE complex)